MASIAKLDQSIRQTIGRLCEGTGDNAPGPQTPGVPGPLGASMIVPVVHSRQTIIFPLNTGVDGGWPLLASNATCIAEGHADISLRAYDGTEFLLAFDDAAGRASIDLEPFLAEPVRDAEAFAAYLYGELFRLQHLVETGDVAVFAWPFFAHVPAQIMYAGAPHWSITIERRGPRGLPNDEPYRNRPIVTIPTVDTPAPNVQASLQSLVSYDATTFSPGQPAAYRVPVRFGLNKAVTMVERAVQTAGDTGTSVGEWNNGISPYIIPQIG